MKMRQSSRIGSVRFWASLPRTHSKPINGIPAKNIGTPLYRRQPRSPTQETARTAHQVFALHRLIKVAIEMGGFIRNHFRKTLTDMRNRSMTYFAVEIH
jgi:hypothetical protein